MPRKRNPENRGFPTRWVLNHGAIYYQVPKGFEKLWDNKRKFLLGHSQAEAYAIWAQRGCRPENVLTIGDLLVRYFKEVTGLKPPQSIKSDRRCMQELQKAFHDVRIEDLTPQHIYQYLDRRSAKIAARREKSMLSHAFTKAVEWGYISKHPFKGEVRLKGETSRTRLIEDWEIDEIMKLEPKKKGDPTRMLQAYIKLKLVMPIRKGDMLRLNVNTFAKDSITVTQGKTGKTSIYTLNPERQEAIAACKTARPKDICQWLFCNRLGQPYFNDKEGTTSGFDSIWQRFMKRVLEETKVTERFTEHDIRAKAGSDAKDSETARGLLGHETVAMTNRAYRRKPEVVK